jgi:hypothetical protein
MQAKQLSVALRAFAVLIDEAGNTKSAFELRQLAESIAYGGSQPVSKIVSKVQKQWKAIKRPEMHPGSLRVQLERVADVMRTSGASAAAKDCAAALKLFAGDPTANAQTYNAEIAAAVQAPAPAPNQKSKPLDAEAIRRLAGKLDAYRTDNDQFDAAIAELESNKQIAKSELEAIANRFLGTERKYKSKLELFKAMKNRQLQDAIQASRERRIDKIAV